MMKLNRLFLSQNISVDNALSMNQILHQIVNQIKEIVDFINNLELRANEYTDQEILKLKNDLESQLETLEQTLKTYTNDKIDEYNIEVINPQLQTIRDTIDIINRTLNQRIDNEVGILNRRINSEVSTLNRIIEDTKTYLEDLIKKGMSYVYSSISGLHLPLQDVLGEIGNVLKQTLSYNWNSIDEFKNISLVYNDLKTNEGYTPILYESGGQQYESDILFKILLIPSYMTFDNQMTQYNNVWCYKLYSSGPPISMVAADVYVNNVKLSDIITLSDYIEPNANNLYIPVDIFTNVMSSITTIGNTLTPNINIKLVDFGNPPRDINVKITFNSLKLVMQELNVNWNSLIYTGVNTFYELNKTEMLFDTDGLKSDYFTGNKYKTIHNNFESDFFKSNINEGNGGN